jgi:hypothetical protein
MRGAWADKGWLFYEFNRAICRIMNDPNFKQDHPSDADRKKEILEDLKASVHADALIQLLETDEVIQKWMNLNKVHERQLKAV